ncbi:MULTISPECIES: hypothetical protein [Streptomyces]|uniref:Uncharacterized protein n=1 Tax=Streptomyces zinciresistens K42 TaxID=700597 RepID=G2G629_9ACTN|nr:MULTISPECIES: hypothetical protein [Streptomyces]EGX61118.1 hypothetical protein SZN_04676 [Streptomyces zinciresistens K42]MDT9696640.1 hypothetical protein [Streptomyces sp. P17]
MISPLSLRGFSAEPVTADTLQVASGVRYDLLVTLDDGAFPLVAVAVVARLVAGAAVGRRLVLRVRPGAGWITFGRALVVLEIRQQGRAELLMSTGLH